LADAFLASVAHWRPRARLATRFGNELRYGVQPQLWATMLGLTADQLPIHRDWPQLLGALRRLARWLEDESLDELSPYMLASRARDLADEIEPQLRYPPARIPDRRGRRRGEHGVGALRAAPIAAELGGSLHLHETIKDALGPRGLLNPGKACLAVEWR